MRTFIAVRIPATRPLQAVLEELSQMQPAVKGVAPEGLHVTLKFLGETADVQIAVLRETIREVVKNEPGCRLALKGLGAFPRVERPSVVWAGLVGAEPLARIAALLDERCADLGFVREVRPFEPHVTLARVKFKPPSTLVDLIRNKADTELGDVLVDAVELIQSDLQPSGPRYSTLESAPLRQP